MDQIIGAMQGESTITDLVSDDIFDNIPPEQADTDYIIVEGAVSQVINVCSQQNRVTFRIMSGNKDGGTFPSLRNIFQAVDDFIN